ncbi:MAG: hypothetical protein AABX11_06310 [Nanoarchaeota archaeon]
MTIEDYCVISICLKAPAGREYQIDLSEMPVYAETTDGIIQLRDRASSTRYLTSYLADGNGVIFFGDGSDKRKLIPKDECAKSVRLMIPAENIASLEIDVKRRR